MPWVANQPSTQEIFKQTWYCSILPLTPSFANVGNTIIINNIYIYICINHALQATESTRCFSGLKCRVHPASPCTIDTCVAGHAFAWPSDQHVMPRQLQLQPQSSCHYQAFSLANFLFRFLSELLACVCVCIYVSSCVLFLLNQLCLKPQTEKSQNNQEYPRTASRAAVFANPWPLDQLLFLVELSLVFVVPWLQQIMES